MVNAAGPPALQAEKTELQAFAAQLKKENKEEWDKVKEQRRAEKEVREE